MLLTSGCKSSKSMKMAKEAIKIGNGGGFAGIEQTITIHEDGMIKSSLGEYKKLKSGVVTQILSNVQVLGLDKLEYNSPGNIYNYVEFVNGSEMKRIAWDPQNKNVPSSLTLFYNNINQIINKSKK